MVIKELWCYKLWHFMRHLQLKNKVVVSLNHLKYIFGCAAISCKLSAGSYTDMNKSVISENQLINQPVLFHLSVGLYCVHVVFRKRNNVCCLWAVCVQRKKKKSLKWDRPTERDTHRVCLCVCVCWVTDQTKRPSQTTSQTTDHNLTSVWHQHSQQRYLWGQTSLSYSS